MSNEDPHLDDDIRAWLNTPVEGPDMPQGATNGSLIATDEAWQACETQAQKEAYLSTREGFTALWNRIIANARAIIAAEILVDWATNWWLTHNGGAG